MPEENREQSNEAFVKLPKRLLTDECYNSLSPISIMVYSVLADRASLSQMNGWIDDGGRVFIYFTINEMAKVIGCGKDRIVAAYKQLEKCGMIERKRQGQGKPAKIYVQDFGKSAFKTSENQYSRLLKIRSQEFGKAASNNTYINNTEQSNNNLSFSEDGYDEIRERIEEQLGYDYLCEVRDKGKVDEIITLICDTLCSDSKTVRIGGCDMPMSVVKSRFSKLDEEHICYVIDCFEENKNPVKNVRAYLLTSLYNSPSSMESYYQALFNRNNSA